VPNGQRGLTGPKRLDGVCARYSSAPEDQHPAAQGGASGIVERLSQASCRFELAGLGVQVENSTGRSARAVKTADYQKLPSLGHNHFTGDRDWQRMGQACREPQLGGRGRTTGADATVKDEQQNDHCRRRAG
jgi:hypothetical protein